MSRRRQKHIKKSILGLMSDRKIRSISQIAREIHANRDTVKRHLRQLVDRFEITQVYNNKRCKLYQIVQKKQVVRCGNCNVEAKISE